jgi:telomere length regulation protein
VPYTAFERVCLAPPKLLDFERHESKPDVAMEGLLTPVSTSYKSSDQREEDFLVEVKKPQKAPSKPSFKTSTPTEALEILKNEPDHESLISTLWYLREESSDFNITSPSPLAAQLVHVLVSDIVPNYWNLLFDGKKSNARKRAKSKSASELDLLLFCLRSVTGLNALLLSLKQLIQQSKETKQAVGGPNIHDVLTILLQVLTELIKGDKTVGEISKSIWNPTVPLSNQNAIWNEFLSVVSSGKILGLAAEAEDVVNELSKKIGEKYWIADGGSYSSWLARNIMHWARTLPADSENEWKCCGDMLGKAFRLGHTGKFLTESSD